MSELYYLTPLHSQIVSNIWIRGSDTSLRFANNNIFAGAGIINPLIFVQFTLVFNGQTEFIVAVAGSACFKFNSC